MVDNTVINPGSGGDTIRDIDRGAGSKTQVVQLDFGGAAANAEQLVSFLNPLPTKESSVDYDTDILRAILIELRVQNNILMQGLLPGRATENLDTLRADEEMAINLIG